MSQAPEEAEPREIAEFRSELRAWIRENLPPEPDFVMYQ